MRKLNWTAALLIAGLIGLSSVSATGAEEKPSDKPKAEATDKPAKKTKVAKLTKPWSGISSLTEEQKAQIVEIHKKSVAEVKEIEQREHDAIMALLNDQQKVEVAAATEKRTVEKKMKKDKDTDAKPAGESEKAPEKAE